MALIVKDTIYVDMATVGPFQTNCYLLGDPRTKNAWLIDAGMDAPGLIRWIEASGYALKGILLTHGHIDHAGGNKGVKAHFDVPITIHPGDEPMLQTLAMQGQMFGVPTEDSPPPDAHFHDGQILELDNLRAEVRHTPGHTPGGVSFYLEEFGIVFAGDTLFQYSIGRTDLPGGNHPQLLGSIHQKLMTLDDDTVVFPGHMAPTQIGVERQHNPFLS